MLLVSMRWTSPDLDLHVTLVAGDGLVVGGEHEEERQEDAASSQDGLSRRSAVSDM